MQQNLVQTLQEYQYNLQKEAMTDEERRNNQDQS